MSWLDLARRRGPTAGNCDSMGALAGVGRLLVSEDAAKVVHGDTCTPLSHAVAMATLVRYHRMDNVMLYFVVVVRRSIHLACE